MSKALNYKELKQLDQEEVYVVYAINDWVLNPKDLQDSYHKIIREENEIDLLDTATNTFIGHIEECIEDEHIFVYRTKEDAINE